MRRYATTHGASGAVRMQNTFATVRDLVITDNAMIGLSVEQQRQSGRSASRSQRNGMIGFGANAAYRLVLRDSIVTNNNVEQFKDAPVAGGVKITRSRDVTVDNVDASSNTGSGIWFDESCYDIKVTTSRRTTTPPPASSSRSRPRRCSPATRRIGGGTGVIIMNTSDVRIFNSDFGGGVNNGVSLKQDARRRPATGAIGWDPRMGGVRPDHDVGHAGTSRSRTTCSRAWRQNSVRALDGCDQPRGRHVEPRRSPATCSTTRPPADRPWWRGARATTRRSRSTTRRRRSPPRRARRGRTP